MRHLVQALCVVSIAMIVVARGSGAAPSRWVAPVVWLSLGLAIAIPEFIGAREDCKIDQRWLLLAILMVLL